MQAQRRFVAFTLALMAVAGHAVASPADTAADRLVRLVDTQGVPAREGDVRALIRSLLPPWASPEVDEAGNLVLAIGTGHPSMLVVAPLDEDGYVVSAVTEDGFLRLHRPTREAQHRLFDQFHVGQPVAIQTRKGLVPGVTATPSTHLRRYLPADDVSRIRGLEDLWVDVGASTRQQVEQLGVRMLDGVALRERAQPLSGGLVAGPSAQGRAGALALVELVLAWQTAPPVNGTLTIAWVSQSLFGGRGLARLVEARRPDQVVVCGLALPPRGKDADPRGAVGVLGAGALIATDDTAAALAAKQAEIPVQAVAAERLQIRRPAGWDGPVRVISTPALFSQTPVETVNVRDAVSLARLVASLTGTPAPAWNEADAAVGRPAAMAVASSSAVGGDVFDTLQPIIESYGVSGHEERPREAVLRALPRVAPWAKPVVDERGNVIVTFGGSGDEMVFVAHLDELGYEITAIRDDGTAAIRPRGGMYDSLYEAHPVMVHTAKGDVPAVLAPRAGYVAAETGPPKLDDLAIYFGPSTSAGVQALGVAAGDTATVRKRLVRLAGDRATARSMDDRAGCAVLLAALAKIDPSKVSARVTFVWSVQEETGLVGAAFVASRAHARYAFAVDTFVSTDSPFDTRRLADNPLGSGAVLRGMDNSTATPPDMMDRLVALAQRRAIPMTIGVTAGGTDASAFARYGATDVGLSWPGRYSHSPAEVTDRRDLEALVALVTAVVLERW